MTRQAIVCFVAMLVAPFVSAQSTVSGSMHDAKARPLSGAVFLTDAEKRTVTAHADDAGKFRFAQVPSGTYSVRAEMSGYAEASFGPFVLGGKETKAVDLTLAPATAEFFDEPNFVVAGVTDTTNRGGHGSDAVIRSGEALARAAASLNKEPSAITTASAATEKSLRDGLVREPSNADLHHALGDIEEKQGNALEAVREYQRAAEISATEANLFDWGSELLTHRAAEQAIEVFAKGNRLFPKSSRMLLGLGAAFYARGSYDAAAQRFFAAADLTPSDPAPYLFLGKVQSPEITQLDGFVERLARFAALQPDNALANYNYASILWKRWKGVEDHDNAAHVEALLTKAVRLDPTLGDAWLQLGILYSSLLDFPRAIAAYQKAIAAGTQHEEVHYRLGQAWQRIGETTKAHQELDLYEQLRKTAAAESERERSEIQQFVFALRQ